MKYKIFIYIKNEVETFSYPSLYLPWKIKLILDLKTHISE